MRVIPGFDFGSTEIPTREKLGLMATGMSVTDIGYEQIDATIIGVTITDASQVSLPAEGWMWVDARSNVWRSSIAGAEMSMGLPSARPCSRMTWPASSDA